MPIFVAGYYMSFETTQKLMTHLSIPHWEYEAVKFEFPINNWLAEKKFKNIRAGAVAHPKRGSAVEDGMLWMTQFCSSRDGRAYTLPERAQDKEAKGWLMKTGGVQERNLEWIQLVDNIGLTLTGFEPQRCCRRSTDKTRWVTEEEKARWVAYIEKKEYGVGRPMGLTTFLKEEAKLKRKPNYNN